MSRIGKKEIIIPKNVLVSLENDKLVVKGKYGLLEQLLFKEIQVLIKEEQIIVSKKEDTKKARALHGLLRALIQNMILGVSNKFSKTLSAEGVGYKFQQDKKALILTMGYSQPIEFIVPDNLAIKLESPTKLLIEGIEKQKVGLFASQIRAVRPPEPYKGKGIRYEGEILLRKTGKTGK